MNNNTTTESGKTAAICSYILVIGVFIAMSINSEDKNAFASFHIRQGLGLTLTFISLGLIISNFDSLMISTSMWIFVFVLSSYGIISAIKGETKSIPLLGNYFQKWLSNIS
jgi:uncharacterized membrane protein